MSKKLGESVKNVAGIRAQLAAAGTVNGLTIDRLGLEDAVLLVSTGAVAGAPTAQTVDAKIQHGNAADASDMADVSGLTITQITAANTEGQLDIDLLPLKRYIRVVATVAFTGGTSPTIGLFAGFTLGKSYSEPVT